jgi:glycosyltransferase involved in cell wall biosynthesis
LSGFVPGWRTSLPAAPLFQSFLAPTGSTGINKSAISNKMKILLIHNTYQQPGGEDVVYEQERRLLQQHGHEVATYQRSNHEIEQFSMFERLGLVTRIISANDSKGEIRNILDTFQPDLVHAHNTFMMVSPSAYEACGQAGVPILQTLQNYRLLCPAALLFRDGHVCEECTEHGLLRGVWHGCYRNSRPATAGVALMLKTHRERGTWSDAVSGYVVPTDFARQKFIDGGLPAEKIYVKPNFVDPDPGERSRPGDYALFVGRLSPEKGLSTLLGAWSRLSTSIPLAIAGDGPLRSSLEAEVAKNKLHQVTFRGRLNSAETRAAMKGARFLVLPSLWYEGFPMVMAESLACGTPVVGSRLGAMQEIITDGRTGLHFTTGDSADLAEKIEWAWLHPAEVAAMGREARRDYEALYTPETNYSLLMAIYEQVLRTKSTADSGRSEPIHVA